DLGGSTTLLTNIRKVLGADVLTAPDQPMVYTKPLDFVKRLHQRGKSVPLNTPMTAKEFNHFVKVHPKARRFEDSGSGDLFGLAIEGTGPDRRRFAATTGSSLNWFVDRFIMSGSNYPLPPGVFCKPTPISDQIPGAPAFMRLPPDYTGLPTPFVVETIDLPQ